ncbi:MULTISPECIES: thioredoxin-dependent thiol peroxidase [unclassified Brevundimonas]|uniref:thioredoxin-dependent thiol peroxidase n=1 Tax=unclassified Brevundimonas TaxID=2622653 RepID=UPI0025C07FC8|nr:MULTISPECIES: thioredoxin-dependent thiol peroxidase [unclassified Brevundimonas]
MSELTQGTPAPALSIATDGDGHFDLAAHKGKKVVVYFYPKADTPGCTTEGLDFSALADDFAKADTTIIGISRDTVKKLDRFKAKHALNLILGSDEDGTVTEGWGVWILKKLYGREYMGIERATFLVDRDGVIAQAWHNVKVKGHAGAVLEAARAL